MVNFLTFVQLIASHFSKHESQGSVTEGVLAHRSPSSLWMCHTNLPEVKSKLISLKGERKREKNIN